MSDIITLDQARTSLRLPTGQTVDDGDLSDLITSATACMEDLCGPIIAHTCDEWYDGGRSTIMLVNTPLTAVTAVVEISGTYIRALTQEPLDGGAGDAYGYTIDLLSGTLIRRATGVASPFISGRRNIHVTYTSGRSPIPVNLQRATRRLVRWLWQTEMQGQRPQNSSPETIATTPSGYQVPTVIKALCGAELRVPGIG